MSSIQTVGIVAQTKISYPVSTPVSPIEISTDESPVWNDNHHISNEKSGVKWIKVKKKNFNFLPEAKNSQKMLKAIIKQ